MKKTYIEPIMRTVAINCAKMIAASGTMTVGDSSMRIVNEGASGEAESRRGSSGLWDEEE